VDLQLGSTLYRNTDGVLVIEGVPQMTISLKRPGGPLLVNFVGFDEGGRVQVKMVDSSLAFNERRAYELTKDAAGLELKHAESGKVLFHLHLTAEDRVVFAQGEFRTLRAHLFQVSPTEWKVDQHQKSGGEVDRQGKSVEIG
jgi:hypothetical protein